MPLTKAQLLKKKQEAKKLITELGYNQKQASQKLGISEKSIGTWCKEYGWVNSYDHQLRQLHENRLFEFALYIERKDPATFKKLTSHLYSFLTSKND